MSESALETDQSVVPENTRVLNVAIPESVYWHLRQCATESRLSMKEYMTEIGRQAKAFVKQAEACIDKCSCPSQPEASLGEKQHPKEPADTEVVERS